MVTKTKSHFSGGCDVAILAGGKGTRLSSRSRQIPKPMVEVDGKPVLQHQIELCKKNGFKKIALLVHHRADVIKDFFGDGSHFDVELTYVLEGSARGTAGALGDALESLSHNFLVLYGDTYLDVNLRKFFNQHIDYNDDASLFLHPNDHPSDSDLVEMSSDYLVKAIHPYPRDVNTQYRNLVNAGLYVIKKNKIEEFIPQVGMFDLAKHTFPLMLERGLSIRGYVSTEYIKDMGTPDRLDKVINDIRIGLPEALSDRTKKSAVFIDRDGTINVEVDHLRNPDQVKLLTNSALALRMLNQTGFLSIVITNQPVVARGEVDLNTMDKIHGRLEMLLGEGGAYLDRVYFCPHHPDRGYQNEVSNLKIACSCRKPATGLIEKAATDLSISLKNSWFIGDSTTDIETGRRMGLKTVLVRTGYSGQDGKFPSQPDFICSDLLDAAEWITKGYNKSRHQLQRMLSEGNGNFDTFMIGGLARSGKSFTASVLKELLVEAGNVVHVICLDGWLRPLEYREEGSGVLNRYDIPKATQDLAKIIHLKEGVTFRVPIYDRQKRCVIQMSTPITINPGEKIIIEGVPALMIPNFEDDRDIFKMYVWTDKNSREKRFTADYDWRKRKRDLITVMQSRKTDEDLLVQKSGCRAHYSIDLSMQNDY